MLNNKQRGSSKNIFSFHAWKCATGQTMECTVLVAWDQSYKFQVKSELLGVNEFTHRTSPLHRVSSVLSWNFWHILNVVTLISLSHSLWTKRQSYNQHMPQKYRLFYWLPSSCLKCMKNSHIAVVVYIYKKGARFAHSLLVRESPLGSSSDRHCIIIHWYIEMCTTYIPTLIL